MTQPYHQFSFGLLAAKFLDRADTGVSEAADGIHGSKHSRPASASLRLDGFVHFRNNAMLHQP